jgi:tetratricopeptide (TPR) repeat protein
MKRYTYSLFFCAFLVCSSTMAQTMLYPKLEKGTFDIGYKTIIDFDYSRTYNLNYPNDTSSQKHDPRPIIINIWYPTQGKAKGKQMRYGDYIKVETLDPTLTTFIKRIEDYNRENSKEYMFYSDSLTAEQKVKFSKHLEQPIPVFKNATPASGKFPLVIYHAGLGGTLNDNTVLCEYLASNGFVVITGALQGNNYKNVNLNWDLERSTKDLDFMLNAIKKLAFIDFSKITAIGHSYGAQAALAYKTEDYSPVSWLLILDSTIDYSLDASPDGFSPLTEKLYGKIKNMNSPMLVFANPSAVFTILDSLKYSDRIYYTFKSQLNHNEFTSLSSFAVLKGLQKRNDMDTVWSKYVLVNKYCLNYLKYQIFKDETAKQFVLSKQPLTNVYEIPKGKKLASEVPEYLDYSKPPSFLQLQKLIKHKKTEIIDKLVLSHPKALNEDIINDAGYSFLKKDIGFAIYLFQKNCELYPNSFNVWDSMGEAYMIKGEKELAITNYKKSVELNPKNKNGIRMLEKLSKK